MDFSVQKYSLVTITQNSLLPFIYISQALKYPCFYRNFMNIISISFAFSINCFRLFGWIIDHPEVFPGSIRAGRKDFAMGHNEELHIADGFTDQIMYNLPPDLGSGYKEDPVVSRLYPSAVGYFPAARYHYVKRALGSNENILLYVLYGSGTIRLKEDSCVLGESDAFIIPAHTPHEYFAAAKEPWTLLWMHFVGTDCSLFPTEDRHVVHIESSYAKNKITYLFSSIFRLLREPYTRGTFRQISHSAETILSEIYDRENVNRMDDQNVNLTNIIHYMHDHLKVPVKMQDLVDYSGFSASYITKIFRSNTGIAPMQYYLKLKMNLACFLLAEGNHYVYDIAHEMGYSDPYYFSRIFQKVIGISPSEYRQKGGLI